MNARDQLEKLLLEYADDEYYDGRDRVVNPRGTGVQQGHGPTKFKVTYATTVHQPSCDARNAARAFIKSLLTPRAQRAGETFVAIDRNTFAIKHVAGGHPAIAKVERA